MPTALQPSQVTHSDVISARHVLDATEARQRAVNTQGQMVRLRRREVLGELKFLHVELP